MKILIIGCGSIGKRHLRNLKSTFPDINLCAFDTSEKSLENIKSEIDVETFSNLDSALNQKLDAVFICTPPNSHVDLAIKCAEKKFNLFIEKPLSNDLSKQDVLNKLVKQNKLITMIGCNLRFDKGFRKLKELIDNRELGKTYGARVEFGYYLPYWRPQIDYRLNYGAKREQGGGIILDAIHELDYLYALFGNFKKVLSINKKISNLEINTEDYAEILIEFENGITSSVHLDYLQQHYHRSCQVIGEKGNIIWNFADNKITIETNSNLKEQKIINLNSERNDAYIDEIKYFINCIKNKKQAIPNILDGFYVLEKALEARSE